MSFKKILYYIVLSVLIFMTFFFASKYVKERLEIERKKIINEKIITMTNQVDSKYHTSKEILDVYRKKLDNNDIVGMIKIENLDINSLILKGHDNIFYLSHLEDKTSNWIGSIMLDYRTDLDSSRVSIIYGHNSPYKDLVFHKLEDYDDYNFYQGNKIIEILTDQGFNKYEIFSVGRTTRKSSKHIKIDLQDDEYLEYLTFLKSISIYDTNVDVNKDDNILIIQTCSRKERDKFYVISARKVRG